MKVTWKDIKAERMHGYFGERIVDGEHRYAEVVRVEAGKWHTFYYTSARQLCLGFETPDVNTHMEARSHAAYFLNTGRIRLFNRY